METVRAVKQGIQGIRARVQRLRRRLPDRILALLLYFSETTTEASRHDSSSAVIFFQRLRQKLLNRILALLLYFQRLRRRLPDRILALLLYFLETTTQATRQDSSSTVIFFRDYDAGYLTGF
ncbi:hypothetical protein FSP39_004361 [Pinctada imbricata]|uniref:Uncharacterized protein n=1 Tax=Pinctada imbricata TaxID=66713 RepID=A0AA88Y4U1_PINIB|nr:hypothetical protein FSP39_004361 [Pinctada imbricata]